MLDDGYFILPVENGEVEIDCNAVYTGKQDDDGGYQDKKNAVRERAGFQGGDQQGF